MDASSASIASMNAMNILQQFSQLLSLQSLAASGQKPSVNSGFSMFGLPNTQQQQATLNQTFQTQVSTSLPPTSPGNDSTKFQTIADILSSHQNLKTELSPTPSTSSSSSTEYSPFTWYGNDIVQTRQYKVHVTRESAKPLQEWMNQHITDPYPSHREVIELSKQTGFTFKQIRNWFTNNRRRMEQQCIAYSLPLPWIKKDAPKVCRKIESSEESS